MDIQFVVSESHAGILASLQMKNAMLVPEEPHAVLIQIVLAMNAIETTPTSAIVEILQQGNARLEVAQTVVGIRGVLDIIECKFCQKMKRATHRDIRREK